MIARGQMVLLCAKNFDRSSFLASDWNFRDGLVLKIQQMGEAANDIFEGPEDITKQYPHIDWSGVIKARHKIAHAKEINYEKIWQMIEEDLPTMVPQLQEMLLKETRKLQ